jgi:hypothetical protein
MNQWSLMTRFSSGPQFWSNGNWHQKATLLDRHWQSLGSGAEPNGQQSFFLGWLLPSASQRMLPISM